MSQYADILEVFRSANKGGIDEDKCIDMFIDIIGALEWDSFDVDYDGNDWQEAEKAAARKALFGNKNG